VKKLYLQITISSPGFIGALQQPTPCYAEEGDISIMLSSFLPKGAKEASCLQVNATVGIAAVDNCQHQTGSMQSLLGVYREYLVKATAQRAIWEG